MSGRIFQQGCGALMVLVALIAPASADPPPPADDRPVKVIKGRDLPEYFCVEKFFGTVHWAKMESPGVWRNFLRKLGVEEGSEAAQVLLLAGIEGQAITSETVDLTPWEHDPTEYRKVGRDHMRSQVRRLKGVWHRFLAEWKKAGQSEDVVKEYVKTRSCNQISITRIGERDPEDQQEYDAILAGFSEPDGQN